MSKLTNCTFCKPKWLLALYIIALSVALSLLIGSGAAQAQSDGPVQVLSGRIEPRGNVFYVIPNLKQGETLYVYVEGTSGNLDPAVGLVDTDLNSKILRETFRAEIDQAIVAGRDPLVVIPEIANDFFLIWDDDGGTGYAAAFEFTAPADGDYRLLVSSTFAKPSFGHYRLLVGLDAPEVLTGEAEVAGNLDIFVDKSASQSGVSVQEIKGALTADNRSTFFVLNDVEADDTLFVFIEATSGDLSPLIFLRDFGGKSLRSGNFSGEQTGAALQYTFDDDGSNYRLDISNRGDADAITTGDYRLLVGLNAPEVLTGKAMSTGQAIIQEPIEVEVGIRMEQITNVDQKAENFGAVATILMKWTDPKLAFSPDTCQCRTKIFSYDEFASFMNAEGIDGPDFTLFNQQGNRWTQNDLVTLQSDGTALYLERFSTTFQAPDFNFRQFPFDSQQFYIRILSIFPEEYYVYKDLENFGGLGEQLGEEEWVVTEFDTIIDSQDSRSRFSFAFKARRYLSFYTFRIFVPVLIIIIVSWITFFLKDYGKRVDVAAANLLLFIAFNFTISDSLPRLGYLTFMDTILVSAFLVTSLVVIFNVYLKRLEVDGKVDLAHRIDKYMIWIYPFAYLIGFILMVQFFM